MSFSTPLFADPGTAATQGLDFWETVIAGSGAGVGSDSTNFRNNARSLKVGVGGELRSAAGAVSSNGRLTFRVLIPAAPGTAQILGGVNSDNTASWAFAISLNSSLQSEFLDSSTRHAGGRTFTTGTWVRFTLAWNRVSTTNFTVKGWSQVDGESSSTLEWTFTNANFTLTDVNVPSRVQLGAIAFSTLTVYYSDIFSDSDSSLTDVGDIQLTPKLPNANVASNNSFDTAIGTNAANRWENVNNRPLDIALGWKQAGNSQVNEYYGIEGAAVGDTDVSANTIVGYGSWVYARQKPQPGALVFASNSSLKASGTSISAVGVFTTNGAVAGDLIVVVVSDQIGTALTISDACATPHTWVQAKQTTSTVRQTVWWTIYNGTTPSGSGTATVSFGSSSAARAITGLRFAGVIAASPVDANPAATTDGTNTYQGPSTGALTQADEIVLALFSWAGPYTDATALDTAGWNTVSGNSTIVGVDGTTGGGATSNVKHLVAWELPGATTSLSTIAHNNTANRAGVQTILSFKLPGGIGSASLRINGSDANIADALSALVSVAANPNYVDTTNSLSQSFATSAIYPSTSGVTGLKSSGTDADTSLYECGAIIFYAPATTASGSIIGTGGAVTTGTAGIIKTRLIAPSGGGITSGTGTPVRGRTVTASGGATIAGSAVIASGRAVTPTGGVVLSGLSLILRAAHVAGVGVAVTNGIATTTRTTSTIASGTATMTGTGTPSGSSAAQSYSIVATGGAATTGTSSIARGRSVTATGGLTSSGVAELLRAGSMTSAGGAITFGAATVTKTQSIVADGGAIASGAATVIRARTVAAIGGATTTGAGVILRAITTVAAGGAVLAGVGTVNRGRAVVAVGSAVTGGGASIITSSPTSFSIAGSGVAVSSGVGIIIRAKLTTGSGLATTTGVATIARSHATVSSGGVTTTGGAIILRGRAITPTGSATTTGTGSASGSLTAGHAFSITGVGSLISSGAGSVRRMQTTTAAGGLLTSGTATTTRAAHTTAAGGLMTAGAADKFTGRVMSPAGGVVLSGVAEMRRGQALIGVGTLTTDGTGGIGRGTSWEATGGMVLTGAGLSGAVLPSGIGTAVCLVSSRSIIALLSPHTVSSMAPIQTVAVQTGTHTAVSQTGPYTATRH